MPDGPRPLIDSHKHDPIPFIDVSSQLAAYRDELVRAIEGVIDSGRLVGGEPIAALEDELASEIDRAYGVAVGSGTIALQILLRALGVSHQDDVVVASFTFAAAAEAIIAEGGRPVWADVNAADFMSDDNDILAALTPQTRGVILSDIFGRTRDWTQLIQQLKARGIWVIEDAAQSLFAHRGTACAGAQGDAAMTSFYPAKPLGALGDAGMIFTNNKSLADRCRQIRNHGEDGRYQYAVVGLNGRMDSLQAAALQVKLAHFADEWREREAIAATYTAALQDTVAVPHLEQGERSTWSQFAIRTAFRDELQAWLRKLGVPSVTYYSPPLHLQPAFRSRSFCPVPLDGTMTASEQLLALPMSAFVTPAHQARVIDGVRGFFAANQDRERELA